MSKSTLKYALSFLGVLVFIALYFMVYMDYSSKTDTLNVENAQLETRLSALKNHDTSLSKYTNAIAQNKTAVADQLGRYYSVERPEDFVMLATELEGKTGLAVTNLSFSEPAPIYVINGVKDAQNDKAPVTPQQLMCYKLSSTISANMKYAQMKQALDYISAQKDVTKLSSLNITFDSSNGLIAGSFAIDKYYITGRDIPEHQTSIPITTLGKSVLIGS